MSIKQSSSLPELVGFKMSESWLDKWKLSHGIKEKQISGESLCIFETTVESWMERIVERCKGYDQKDIWNMNESDCFFKVLSAKGLAQRKKVKGGKKSKQRITAAFFVSTDGGKVGKPIVIFQSKKPICFRLVSAPNKLAEVSCFDDSKSWMQVEIMEKVLETINFQKRKERRNVF